MERLGQAVDAQAREEADDVTAPPASWRASRYVPEEVKGNGGGQVQPETPAEVPAG